MTAGHDAPLAGPRRTLRVGLVNNMPDAALQATEQQFRDLLAAASGAREVELVLIALPEVPRGPVGRRILEERYVDLNAVRQSGLDGLIVTGAEPKAARLNEEPYWAALAGLIDWARESTVSALWSCLAAHAAALHLDGVERRRFPDKLCGVFVCPASAEHRLVRGLRDDRRVPQSRYNDLPEAELRRAGYEILARSDAVGADFFVKDCGSLFVFLQGHPEYDRMALAREYRRDVARYLAGERESFPPMLRDYFSPRVEEQLQAFREHAQHWRATQEAPAEGLLTKFPPPEQICPEQAHWRMDAVRVYANWLELIETRGTGVSACRAAA